MAKYNEILTGRHNRLLQKLFSMKGDAPAPQLSSEVQMIHPYFHGRENRYLESWQTFGFGVNVAAVAAINSTLRFRNPAGSNVVAVIEKASVGASVADTMKLGYVKTNADLVVIAPGANNVLDLRQLTAGPTLIISNSDATHPGSLITTLQGSAPLNQMYEFVLTDIQELPLLPGHAMDLFEATVNQTLVVSVLWRERFLEESERS